MIEKNTDIDASLKSLLLYQFQQQPNFLGLISGFATSSQDIENEIYRFLNELSLKDAVGQQLDGIGEILGEERENRDDETYRAALSVRITINISRGEPETLISVLAAITNSSYIQLTELFPARVEMFFNGVIIPPDLIENMNKVKAAGVQLQLVGNSSTNPFVFAGDPLGGGFNEEGQSLGGEISEVYV